MKKKKMRKTAAKGLKSTRKSQFNIFDPGAVNHIDALQVALLRSSKDTLLPELYEIFGKSKLLKFLDIFSGTTIVVPDRDLVENSIRDTFIYISVSKAVTYRKKERVMGIVKDLADRYSISKDDVWNIYQSMKRFSSGSY